MHKYNNTYTLLLVPPLPGIAVYNVYIYLYIIAYSLLLVTPTLSPRGVSLCALNVITRCCLDYNLPEPLVHFGSQRIACGSLCEITPPLYTTCGRW